MTPTNLIGKRVLISVERGKFQIEVTIIDVKQVYGHIKIQVEPVKGLGKLWMEFKRITQVMEDS